MNSDAVKWDISRAIAMIGHDAIGQVRRNSGDPYWVHCRFVAEYARKLGLSIFAQMAGWCHDLLEDTDVQESTLRATIGNEATNLVVQLTDLRLPRGFNRAKRKAIQRLYFASKEAIIHTLKGIDLLGNAIDIFSQDKTAFRFTFWVEARLLLDVLVNMDPRVRTELETVLKENMPQEHILEKEMAAARRADEEVFEWFAANHSLLDAK